MTAELIVHVLLRIQVALAASILPVLIVRPFARRLLGPEIAYRLWP
jgi:beta-lactamase regulating signal transducer with metallopeptidase domain